MTGYFRSRHTWLVVAVILALESALSLLHKPLVVFHESGILAFAPLVPLQILPVGALTLALSGRTEQFEFAGVRPLRALRLMNLAILAGVGVMACATAAAILQSANIDFGTVGAWASLRAFVGLAGISALAVSFTDMRVGVLFAAPFVIGPAAFDMSASAAGSFFGFVLAPGDSLAAWSGALVALFVGSAAYCLAYTERNSPSSDRQALRASRRSVWRRGR